MSLEINVEIMRGLGPEFAQHLNISNNNRIIFSGKFGKGKTTFIKYFFENQDDFFDEIKFLPIYIKPINYSISKNENILQYIKYDILIELIKKIEEPGFVKDGVAVAKVFPEYIENFQEELGKKILYFLPKIGKSLPVVGDILEAFFEDLNNFVTEKESANTNFVLGKFLKNVEESNFSIYENDIITKLIINIISELKLKTILIIDDLDRIDPDHIFRILNVFSVHFDENDNEIFINKFGLDKIMTVCDIKNLRHTFISKYGADVDFNGYIDKFYSKEVFHFQNHNQIKDFCIKHLSSQLVQTKNATNIIGQILNRNIGIDFFSMITILIEYNYISLRSILNYNFKNKLFEDFKADGPLLNFHNTTVQIEIKALSALCGGFESFVKIIKSLIDRNITFDYAERGFVNIILFKTVNLHHYRHYTGDQIFNIPNKELLIQFKRDNGLTPNILLTQYKNDSSQIHINYSPNNIDFYNLLLLIIHDFNVKNYIE